jgi:threonine/homoserine/homoserine lactone efflux protein
MPFSFSPTSLIALFLALFLLALAPNLSVLIVTTRAATAGSRQGILAILGIVAATLIYVFAAIIGLMIVADMRPEARQVLRLLSAIYLIWSGMGVIRNSTKAPLASLPVTHRDAASFSMGFILTMINVKALLLYLSFLPVFMNPGSLNFQGTLVLLAVVALATGTAKSAYAVASAGGRIVPSIRVGKALNVVAGIVLAVSGFLLASGRVFRP